MQSKLAIVITLCGWLLFAAWLAYDYAEYQERMIIHIFKPPYSFENSAFYIMVILFPIIYSVIGFLVNERAKLFEKIKESEEKYRSLSLFDELTGLHNRRGFFSLVEQQFKIANRTKEWLLLLFVDIDNLQQINDTLGHNEGDWALIDIANILRWTFRKSDIIARIGGDDFAVLATKPSNGITQLLATRLKESLKSFNIKGSRHYTLSLSIGFARYDPETPCSIEDLFARASATMGEQKRTMN